MRVLVVGKNVTAVHRQLVWMVRGGCEILFVGESNPYEGIPPVRYRFLPLITGEGASQVSHTEAIAQIKLAADQFQPDIIHAHGLDKEAAWCVEAGLQPLVISAQGYLNRLAQNPSARLPITLDRMILASQALVFIGPAGAEAVRTRYPDRPKVVLLTQGLDVRHYQSQSDAQGSAWRQCLKLPLDAFVLASPRGWGKVYNHHLIVRAFASARQRCEKPTYLVYTRMGRNNQSGEAEIYFNEVMNEATSLGIKDAIRILPPMPHRMMPGVYAMSDAVISYPAQDALAVTLIEAAACQRPIITARLPDYAGTFLEQSAVMVEPNRVDSLTDALVTLVNQDPEERRELLKITRDRVMERYDDRLSIAELLRLYQALSATN